MVFVRFVFAAAIGAVFGLASAFALSPAMAAMDSLSANKAGGQWMVYAVIAAVALACALAPTIRRAFGRGFMLLGLCLLALPLTGALLSSVAVTEVVGSAPSDQSGAALIGAGAAGVLFTGIATFVGLIGGGIAVIIGLVLMLGGRREVIIIERNQPYVPVSRGQKARKEPPLSR